jgi:hypothetical protein
MDAIFKYELDDTELERIKLFCNSVDYCSIEQFIGWTGIFYKSRICYFYLSDQSGIISFCQIREWYGSAHILFGPVCCDKEIMISSLCEIINHYKQKRYFYLGVQMYLKSGPDTEYIEYSLNRKYDIIYLFDQENTFTSIEVDLGKSLEQIKDSYSNDIRRNIRKAQKLGVFVDTIKDERDFVKFSDIYSRMLDSRQISIENLTSEILRNIYLYLGSNNRGEILLVKDKEGIIIGGIILVFQGNSLRMFKSCTDPARKNIPVKHILVDEIINRAKLSNFKYLDFWGYSHLVDEKDQITGINSFKKGFGGYFTFFAKKMNVNLIPYGYYIYCFLLFAKKILLQIQLFGESDLML